ncbi:2-C-methyl-D-erythritol 4-phosphate cytidylyltransferase [Paenibacillus daejeonensis]|uniref:2-C-methyl-D-erythritol 4-phosphate cytidylyltransferase n=1 Tax=Paenibacillus daejeonensis TaxID=135193 RepID=UPI000373E040|nr:2-C-methyl-D-erythritol 4-phosphate cytidylyltransferase [Paenibacillus daejeonensis]
MQNQSWAAVVVAAGRGTRMGTAESKQYLSLGGKPILARSLALFQAMSEVSEIVLVVGSQDVERCQAWTQLYGLGKLTSVVAGGADRQESVYLGLQAVTASWVLVHDGVRPLVSQEAVRRCCSLAEREGAAVLAVPVKDTIKQVDGDGLIVATPDRRSLWAIQTPQAFRYDLLLSAHQEAMRSGFSGTDDAMMVEHAGRPVKVAEGEYTNLKITTPEDLPYAEFLLTQGIDNPDGGGA